VVLVDEKPVLQLKKTTSELESATKYVKPDRGLVGDENARAACDYFGVKHKGEATKHKDKDGKDGGR
jgi:hypothetical protein